MNSTATSTGPLVEEQAAARAQSFSREEWVFLAIAAIITILRTYSRWSMVGWRRFQADDVLVWLALVSDNKRHWATNQCAKEGLLMADSRGMIPGLVLGDDSDRCTIDRSLQRFGQ